MTLLAPARLCDHDGCVQPHDSGGYCKTHATRVRLYGDSQGRRCEGCGTPLSQVLDVVRSQRWCSDGCRPRCAFDGCGKPAAKVGWCHPHYVQQRRSDSMKPRAHEWAPKGGACRVCGEPAGLSKQSRRYCSDACSALGRRYGDDRPLSRACALCAAPIDMMALAPSGSRRKMTTRLCDRCRVRKKFRTSVFAIAKRDGTLCTICGEYVDMTLRRKDSVFCPSIDHVVPRARGGTDDPTNLALAHFWCNAVKSAREDFTI